jgi:hypothetical protein
MLIKLFKKSKLKYEWRGDLIDTKTFVEKAIKSNERQAIVIKQQEAFSTDEIKEVRLAFRETFNQDIKEDSDINLLIDEIKQKCSVKLDHYQKLSDEYHGKVPFGVHFNNYVKILSKIIETRDPKALFAYLAKFKDANKKINDNCKENEDFLSNQLDRYLTIKAFVTVNQINFEILDEVEKSKASQLVEYFKAEDMPGNTFPQVRKMYEELSKDLKELVEKLKIDAAARYSEIFAELESKALELGIKDQVALYSSDAHLKSIDNEKNIANLHLLLSQADDFKAKSLKAIIDSQVKENGNEKTTEVISDLSCIIENEDQLDSYIQKLKDRLLSKLKENKIIIIR